MNRAKVMKALCDDSDPVALKRALEKSHATCLSGWRFELRALVSEFKRIFIRVDRQVNLPVIGF